MTVAARPLLFREVAKAIAPRPTLTVSQWADRERVLSNKGSAEPGRWRTSRNPPLREPMDMLSARSTVHEVVVMFPIQFGKTEIAVNFLGYTMDYNPGAIMVCLPGEVSMNKWVSQKLNPMLEETEAVKRSLTSVASRDASNTRTFKDFKNGQLYLEHAGSPARLKSTTVRDLIVDELDAVAQALTTEDDPQAMLEGRTSAHPATYKVLYISTPDQKSTSRIDAKYESSDQRRYHVPCPDCGHLQPFEWSGLHYLPDGSECWYVCRACSFEILEHHKTKMIAAGRWIAKYPERKIRGYTANCLYYQIGLGPRWLDLVRMWLGVQNDPAKLKTFVNDRFAEAWEDPRLRKVKFETLRDRAEHYRLRIAPLGVLAIVAGVDTQDDRLEVQIVGFGRDMAPTTLDYVVLNGDPANDDVWVALTELLNKPIQHISGELMPVEATAIDAGGHRTEYVKNFVRKKLIRRPLCIFGAKPANAPVLSKGKLEDVNFAGKLDRRGVTIHHVGTKLIKDWLFGRIAADADREPDDRLIHLSDELDDSYFGGLVSEVFDPKQNRYVKRKGSPRNEPLDTWVYAYAATHHPELRLHRLRDADWDGRASRLGVSNVGAAAKPAPVKASPVDADSKAVRPGASTQRQNPFASSDWLNRR